MLLARFITYFAYLASPKCIHDNKVNIILTNHCRVMAKTTKIFAGNAEVKQFFGYLTDFFVRGASLDNVVFCYVKYFVHFNGPVSTGLSG